MQFFGDDIERANREGERVGTRGPRNLLELLPDEFSMDDVRKVVTRQGKDAKRSIYIVKNWINRKYVIQNSEFSFQKSGKYKKH